MTARTPPLHRFRNAPLSAVFTQPRRYPWCQWRIRGSGVYTAPDDAPTTAAVFAACDVLGIPFEATFCGGPCSADAYPVRASFLDGGLDGRTGNYFGSARGVTVTGPRAVLLLALTLGLRVTPGWREGYGLAGVTLDELREELLRPARTVAAPPLHGMPLRVYPMPPAV